MIYLDRNEAPFDVPENIKGEVVKKLINVDWNRYPSVFCESLKEKIANFNGVSVDRIFIGNGSSEVIQHIICLYRHQCNRLVYPNPGFDFFRQCGNIFQFEHIGWDNTAEMRYDYENFPAKNRSIYILCHPNNPSGDLIELPRILKYIETEPDSIFIIDEAYIEFSGCTFIGLCDDYKNVFIVRTMSKAIGAAGVRLGYGICHPKIASETCNKHVPYRLNHFSMIMGSYIFDGCEKHINFIVNKINIERQRLFLKLESLLTGTQHKVFDSRGNFLLTYFDIDDPIKYFLSQKISLAPVTNYPKFCRITVGTPEENDEFIRTVEKIL